jgi:hypothetical protein
MLDAEGRNTPEDVNSVSIMTRREVVNGTVYLLRPEELIALFDLGTEDWRTLKRPEVVWFVGNIGENKNHFSLAALWLLGCGSS